MSRTLEQSANASLGIAQDQMEAAGEWMLRLQAEDLDPQELAAWVEWYASPQNRAAFDEMQSRYETLRQAPTEQRQKLAARIMTVSGDAPGVAPASAAKKLFSPASRGDSRPWRARVAAAAALVVLVAGALGVSHWQPWRSASTMQTAAYHTPRAQHDQLKLPDDSVVQLGALSSVSLSFTNEGRYLVLEGGEAFFNVAPDPGRPFIVQAGEVTIKAVGTAFNVRRTQGRVVVTVKEGIVDVAREPVRSGSSAPSGPGGDAATARAVRVVAGEQVRVDLEQTALAVSSVDTAAALAWQSGRLEFVNEPLSAVIATVNRYSAREIVLGDGIADISYTGTVAEGRTEEWLLALQEVFPVQVTAVGMETIVLSPR